MPGIRSDEVYFFSPKENKENILTIMGRVFGSQTFLLGKVFSSGWQRYPANGIIACLGIQSSIIVLLVRWIQVTEMS